MLAEKCVRVLGFLVVDIVGTVILILLCIFYNLRKVFYPVFRFNNGLFSGLSGFGF